MEYDKMAQGVVTSLGGATPVILPFAPTRIQISNPTRTGANSGVSRAWWDVEMGQGAAMLVTSTSSTSDLTTYVTTGGFSTFQAGIALQYGPVLTISSTTKGNPTIITTSTNHNLITGNVVIMSGLIQTSTTGMQQICDIPFVITKTGANTFTVPFNTSGSQFVSYNVGTATVKQILYPSLYYPGSYPIAAISTGSTTTVDTTVPHNFVVGQEVAFRIPSVWGTYQLNSLPNILIPGSPTYGFVTTVNSSTEVIVNINSTGYTAFAAPTAAQDVGVAYPQILAVGDNNSGSLLFGYTSNTINGPAISGAYLNNTNQGFIIGASVAGTASDTIYWEADFASIT